MKTIKVVIFLIFVWGTKIVNAQTYVAIPDSNFVHYLKTIIPTAFKGDSLNKNSTLVTTSTIFITVPGKSIANLSGIQYFTSLNSLNCDGNQLTSLPTLPYSLNYLTCNNNNITSLPILPNKLIELACSNNPLSNLPVLPDSLVYLDCNNNNLTSLPALPNSLKSLLCGYNNIACFPIFPSSIIDSSYFNIDPNPYNCLPNHITAMNSTDLAKALCAAGNTNGCPVSVAGIEQFASNNMQVTVYPNPNNGSFVIEPSPSLTLPEGKGTLMQVYDVNGKLVLSQSLTPALSKGEGVSIDASSLSEGVYNISLQSNEGVVNKRLVIVR